MPVLPPRKSQPFGAKVSDGRPTCTIFHENHPMKLIYTVVKAVILLFFLLLAIVNTDSVSFFYLPGQKVDAPLIVILFGSFLIGIVFGMFALFGRLLSLRSENNRLRTEVRKHAHLSEKDLAPAPSAPAATPAPSTTPKP